MATFPFWEHPGRSLGISCQNSCIPDRRVGVMKYRSGNARAATRGGFAFQFLDQIPSMFGLCLLHSIHTFLSLSLAAFVSYRPIALKEFSDYYKTFLLLRIIS